VRSAGSLCIGSSAMAASLPDGSRVRRESHARFCERLEVKSLRPTHPTVPVLEGPDQHGTVLDLRSGPPAVWGREPTSSDVLLLTRPQGRASPGARYASILQADAYDGYRQLYQAGRQPGPIREAACWSHGRRPFFALVGIPTAVVCLYPCAMMKNAD